MKNFKLLIIGLVAVIAISGCKKDDDPKDAVADKIAGTWTGNYGFEEDSSGHYFSFHIKANGVMEDWSSAGKKQGEGTWKLSGNEFKATYHSLPNGTYTYSVKAVLSSDLKRLEEGTWGRNASYTSEGKWYMSK